MNSTYAMGYIGEADGGLLAGLEVVRAERRLWERFAGYHYRNGSLHFPSDIFALQMGSGEPVAIIVYSYPHANCAARNRVLAGHFGGYPQELKLSVLNHELRTISRLVVLPQFRGIGLASELIRRTVWLVGVRYIEAIAVMAKYTNCFGRAGFREYDNLVTDEKDMMVRKLYEVGIDCNDTISNMERAFDRLANDKRESLVCSMHSFCCHYNRSARKREASEGELRWYLAMIKMRVGSKPGYYLYDLAGG